MALANVSGTTATSSWGPGRAGGERLEGRGKRSRRQKGILAFLARDADHDLFCYANAELRKEDQADEILRFVEFWEQRTGHLPEELVFDSKLTIYANLHQLNLRGISFITLRRRSQKMLDEARQQPLSAWRKVELKNIARAYRHPRVIDQKIQLKGYEQPIRQLIVADLGHEAPTFLLTNQMRPHPATLIQRYAYRMIIENGIADGVDFFHMDALSSVVPMKVTPIFSSLSWPTASTASSATRSATAMPKPRPGTPHSREVTLQAPHWCPLCNFW